MLRISESTEIFENLRELLKCTNNLWNELKCLRHTQNFLNYWNFCDALRISEIHQEFGHLIYKTSLKLIFLIQVILEQIRAGFTIRPGPRAQTFADSIWISFVKNWKEKKSTWSLCFLSLYFWELHLFLLFLFLK